MIKNYTTKLGLNWFSSMLITLMALFCASAVHAQNEETVVDFGKMELNKSYEINDDFKDYKGYFVAEKSGTLTGTGSFGCLMLPYTDTDCLVAAEYTHSYTDNGEAFTMNVESGKTYYMFVGFSMSIGSFKLTMDEATGLKLVSATPADQSTFDLSQGGLVTVQFNKSVNVKSVEIKCNNDIVAADFNLQSANVAIDIKKQISDFINQGKLKEGEQFSVILKGICDEKDEKAIYGENGELTLTYTLAQLPVTLVKTTNVDDNTFLSYWQKNNGKGIITLTFSDELQTTSSDENAGVAVISYGELEAEAGEYYQEEVPYSVKGKDIVLDLTNKLRRPKDMVRSATTYEFISIKVKDIRSADGRYVYCPGKGGLGSFSVDMPYQEVKAEPISEFTPGAGSTASLKNIETLEIWVSDYKTIAHEGILFECENKGKKETAIVTKFEEKADADNEGAYILNVKVPEIAKNADNVIVSFNKLQCIDGLDHSTDLTAVYGVPTGIEELPHSAEHLTIYNVSGVKVNVQNLRQLPKGLYIVNGKKCLINNK